jgi:hypothetical protein
VEGFRAFGRHTASFERWWPQVFGSANTARLSADD